MSNSDPKYETQGEALDRLMLVAKREYIKYQKLGDSMKALAKIWKFLFQLIGACRKAPF